MKLFKNEFLCRRSLFPLIQKLSTKIQPNRIFVVTYVRRRSLITLPFKNRQRLRAESLLHKMNV